MRRRTPVLTRRAVAAVTGAVVLACGTATSARAAPANDARADAQRLGPPPATVTGTTVGATLEPTEPPSCESTAGSVWYRFTAGEARELVVAFDARGDMDAAVDVFVRERSQTTTVACARTDRRGEALVDFDADAGTEYLVRVAPLANSVADEFRLRLLAPRPAARPPGRRLAARGSGGTVDRIVNPDDAWWVRLRAGRTYRIGFSSSTDRCAELTLYEPGVRDFGGGVVVDRFSCRGYRLLTPAAGASGRYVLRVTAPRQSRQAHRYRLRVAPAGPDDTGPGRPLANDVRIRGRLRGSGVDAVDLYRFSVARRSDLALSLRAGRGAAFDLLLLDDRGRRRACACNSSGALELRVRQAPGRYFVAVRARDNARGRYVLRRLSRTITRTRLTVNGRRAVGARPGVPLRLTVTVSPAVDGPVTMLVERFDPLAGWQFAARSRRRAIGGAVAMAFRPPSVGRWRFRASFEGTRTASPSVAPIARALVAEPLR